MGQWYPGSASATMARHATKIEVTGHADVLDFPSPGTARHVLILGNLLLAAIRRRSTTHSGYRHLSFATRPENLHKLPKVGGRID